MPGGDAHRGQQVWTWGCSGDDNQAWLWRGYNLRWGPDLTKCLDLPAGNAENGQKLWIWDCSGEDNQKFGYNSDSGDGSEGNQLMMWECNGLAQQHFDVQGIYNS